MGAIAWAWAWDLLLVVSIDYRQPEVDELDLGIFIGALEYPVLQFDVSVHNMPA
jgi:hypothetical protein